MFFLSIIIPVYNAEHYLPDTLSKLAKELPSDCEVIIVDDGSDDASLSICNEFSAQHQEFHVYTQSNAGPSAARNRGLKAANGHYITFLDADDEFSPETLNSTCDYLRKHDTAILFLQVERLASNRERRFEVKYNELKELTRAELRSLWCSNSALVRGFCGGKIYAHGLIDEFSFPEDMRFAEDMYALSDILVKTHEAVFFPIGSYLYYEREDTPTTGVWTIKKSRCLLKAYIHRWQCAVSHNFPIDDQIHAWSHALALFVAERKSFPGENWKDIREQLNSNAYTFLQILQSSLSFKQKLGLLRNRLLL